MRDLVFVAFLGVLFAFGAKRPFAFVLTYVYIDLVSPQRLTYILLNAVPISLIAVALTVGAWLFLDDKKDSRFAPRQGLFAILLVYCWVTTLHADFPVDAAFKWEWVWKALAFAIFLPLTLRTKLRIEALLLFMILSAASIIIVGGIKTIFSGGGYGELNLMVTNNSRPLRGQHDLDGGDRDHPADPVVHEARHDLSARLAGEGVRLCAGLRVPADPGRHVDAHRPALHRLARRADAARCETPDAVSRRDRRSSGCWRCRSCRRPSPSGWGRSRPIRRMRRPRPGSPCGSGRSTTPSDHPFGGGFEAYRQNEIRYEKVKVDAAGANATVDRAAGGRSARAYHSAYFEMLGEQGYPGLAIWLMINWAGIWRMEMLRRRYHRPRAGQEWVAPLASALQQGHLVYMLGAIFVAIAFQPFVFMLIGAQIGLDTYLARLRKAEVATTIAAARTRPVGGVTQRHQLDALTAMRGIAAWLVVLYHIRLSMDWMPEPLVGVLAKGYLAVDFFFLLSGFVIWLSWGDRLRGGGLETIGVFLQRRIARIWPLHVAMLGFGVLLATALAITGRADPQTFPPTELPLHVLLVQNWGFTTDLTWNDPAWSISCELAAYIAFPLLAFAIDWRRVPTSAVIAAIAAMLVLLHAIFAQSGALELGDQIPRLGVIRCLLEFAAGTAVCALWLRWRDRPRLPAIAATLIGLALLASSGWLGETLAVPAAFASLLLALALTSGLRRQSAGRALADRTG